MLKCPFCNSLKLVDNLLAHAKLKHKTEMNSEVTCNYSNCNSKFVNIYAYKKHAKLIHAEVKSVPTIRKCKEPENNVIDKITKESTSNDEYFACYVQHENINNFVTNISNILDEGLEIISYKQFSEIVINNVAYMIGELYAKSKLNRESVHDVIKAVVDFYKSICIEIIKKKYQHINGLSLMLSIIQSSFEQFKTEQLTFKYFIQKGSLILPKAISINTYLKCRSKNGESKPFQSFDGIQVIPIKKVLKKFLELPGVQQSILSHIEKLKQSDCLDSLFKGELYKSIEGKFQKKILIPLTMYSDDVEINNAMGSRKVIHKIGNVYYSILGLPDQYSSQLENIFLFQIHNTEHHKNFGNERIFSNIIEQLVDLINNGISINCNGTEKHFNFIIFQIIGDNLGANTMLGFSKSFNATQYCRICVASKDTAIKLSREDPKLLRNEKNYEDDCKHNCNGVKENCIFNKLPYFHVTKNTCVDPMHDLFEGICRYDMGEILNSLIGHNHFSLEILNHRISCFNKSLMNDKNILPSISVDSVTKKFLLTSASEMSFFIQYFGLLIGDLVAEKNEAWQLYLLLREIVNIVLAPAVTDSSVEHLIEIIHQHHILYVKLSNQSLKPKFHFLIHYPTLMKKLGPLMQYSCFRFEGKHKTFKDTANSMTSRLNAPYTLALKHQLQLNLRYFSNKGLSSRLETGPESRELNKILDYNNFKHILPKDLTVNEFVSVTWVRVNGTLYKKNTIILLNTTDVFIDFGQVFYYLVDRKNEDVYFLYKKMLTTNLNEHMCAYEVRETNIWNCSKQTELGDYLPYTVHVNSDGKMYVPSKI